MSDQNKIKVLHILPSMHGYGAERQIMHLLARLQSPQLEAALLTVYSPTVAERSSAPFPVFDAARNGRRDFTFIGRLVEKVRHFGPDIVHAHTHVGKYWGRIAAAAAGVPVIVYTEHNPCDPRRSALDYLTGRALNPHTARCVTFFPEQREMIEQLDGLSAQKIDIIPNGLDFATIPRPERDPARAALGVNDGEFAILLIGRMEYQKNHALALSALAAVPHEERRKIVLLFAGSGVLEAGLKESARALGIANQTRFLGFRSDVPQVLAAADLLLMTSHFEGMPLTLLEGMFAGVPILTTPWTGAHSMLGTGAYGRIAPSWEVAVLAREIAEIASGRLEFSKMMRNAARQYVMERFSLHGMVEAHRQLYFDLALEQSSAA